jgi:hypothetical protein
MPLKSPEQVVRNALVTTTAVSSLVGTRIYPVLAPTTAALPFAVYRRSSIQRQQTLAGPLGLPTVNMEMQIYATTYEGAREVADTFRSVLDGYGGTLNNVEVQNASLEQESDDFVQLAGAELPPVYSVTQNYALTWVET